jgi:hypothetical protein
MHDDFLQSQRTVRGDAAWGVGTPSHHRRWTVHDEQRQRHVPDVPSQHPELWRWTALDSRANRLIAASTLEAAPGLTESSPKTCLLGVT